MRHALPDERVTIQYLIFFHACVWPSCNLHSLNPTFRRLDEDTVYLSVCLKTS